MFTVPARQVMLCVSVSAEIRRLGLALRGVRGARLVAATYQEVPLTRCTYTPRGAPQAQAHGCDQQPGRIETRSRKA
jgi:hypothetical protein